MRGSLGGNQTALIGARNAGLVPRQLIWVTGRHFTTGNLTSYGMWSGDDVVDIAVTDGTTGGAVSRTYFGGVSLAISSIPRVADLTLYSVSITFSQIAPIAQEIARGLNLRMGRVEIHTAFLDTNSRLQADTAEIEFLGQIDGSPISTPGAGGDGSITLTAVSEAMAMLTRANPRLRSYEGQKRRQGDEFGRYANTVGHWHVQWGDDMSQPTAEPPAKAKRSLSGEF